MNKDEVVKLAKENGMRVYFDAISRKVTGTPDELLAFANACEKIGMEKAAKICDARYIGDNSGEDLEATRCAAVIRKEIK